MSGSQQQAVASSSQLQQASPSVIIPCEALKCGEAPGIQCEVLGVERSLSRGKRDPDLDSAHILSERRNLQKLNELFREKWTEEIGNKEMLILPSLKPIDNLILGDWRELHQVNQWADQAQREKICLF